MYTIFFLNAKIDESLIYMNLLLSDLAFHKLNNNESAGLKFRSHTHFTSIL